MLHNPRKIAVLMATYNAAKYIAEQIESIIVQTNQDWTLYIRDDASQDNTVEIIERYCSKYDSIIMLKDAKGNLGCKDNFFELLLSVESQYYMFSDADDVWLPEKIKISFDKIIELEETNPTLPIVVHTDMCIVDANLNITTQSMWRAGKFNPDKIKSYNYLGLHGFVGGATMIYNRKAKEVSLPINPAVYMHDLWIGLCVIKSGIVYSLHKQPILYRQHSSNSVGGASSNQLTFVYKLKNIKKVIKINLDTYRMLHKIGYGSFVKYLYYKTKLVWIMRSGKMFDQE